MSRPGPTASSPVTAYRWEHTDAALTEQLDLETEGHPGVVEPGHAAVRFTNPTTGGDVLPTVRAEVHRLRAGISTATRREVGSSVWQVFDGSGSIRVGEHDCLTVDGVRYEMAGREPARAVDLSLARAAAWLTGRHAVSTLPALPRWL